MTSSVITRSLRRLASCMKRRKSLHRAEIGIDVAVVGDVIAVVATGRGVERQQPQGRDPELLEVVELFSQADEIPDAIVVAVGKGLDVKLIDDRVLEPELVAFELGLNLDVGGKVHGTFMHAQRKIRADLAPDQCAGALHPIR